MSEPDLGMLFIPDLSLIAKIHRDSKGDYIVLKGEKCYLGKEGSR